MENVRRGSFLAFNFNLYIDEKGFDFIKTSESILRELIFSKEHGNVIGINATSLGNGMFITGVEDILLTEAEPVIVLKPYDMSGYIFPRNRVYLSEIISVCPFKSEVKNPYLDSIDKDKTWFF